jgi:hypothetical protein
MALTVNTVEGTDFVVVNETGAPRDLVFTKPTAVASGKDICVLIAIDASGADATTTWTPASDFTNLFDITEADGQPKMALWRKRAGGSEPANYTFSYAAATGTLLNAIGVMWVVDGADDSTFEDTAEVYSDQTTGAPTCPDITTVTNGAVVFAATALSTGQFLNAVDTNYPSGYTGMMSRVASVSSSSPALSIAFKTQATAGAVGTAQYTGLYSSATGNARSVSFAIRPAAGGGASGVPRFMNVYRRRRS